MREEITKKACLLHICEKTNTTSTINRSFCYMSDRARKIQKTT